MWSNFQLELPADGRKIVSQQSLSSHFLKVGLLLILLAVAQA
jgi:hypothetical protein